MRGRVAAVFVTFMNLGFLQFATSNLYQFWPRNVLLPSKMNVAVSTCWFCLALTVTTFWSSRDNGTILSRAMLEFSYTASQLRVTRPSRQVCKVLHRESCVRIRSAGGHRQWVSCCRGARAGRLHRLMTSHPQLRMSAVGRPSPRYTQGQLLWEFPARTLLMHESRKTCAPSPMTTSTTTLVNTTAAIDVDNVLSIHLSSAADRRQF